MQDIARKRVHVDGKFPGLTNEEILMLVVAHGATPVPPKKADVLLTANKKSKAAAEFLSAGKPVIALGDLGEPLEGWFDRVKARVAELASSKEKSDLRNFGFGRGASDATLERIAKRVGFELPAAFKRLARSFDGLSFLHARSSKELVLPRDSLLPWARFAHSEGEFWKAFGSSTASAIAIVPWEEMFFGESYLGVPTGPVDVRIGKQSIAAADLAGRIFPFDLYHWYTPTALYADPDAREFFILHTTDHGADLAVSERIPLWLYVESLLAGGHMSHTKIDWAFSPPGRARYWRPLAAVPGLTTKVTPFPMLAVLDPR